MVSLQINPITAPVIIIVIDFDFVEPFGRRSPQNPCQSPPEKARNNAHNDPTNGIP